MQWLNSIGIAVSLFFVLFIIAKKDRTRADFLLTLINLLLIGFLVLDLVVRTKLTAFIFFLQAISPYLFFPIYILYALEVIQQGLEKVHHRLWLFIPIIASTVFLGSDLFLFHSYGWAELQNLYDRPPVSYHILYKGNQLLFIAGLVWLIKKLRKRGNEIKEQFSFIDPIRLNWLMQTSWVYLAITIVSFLTFVASNLKWLPVDINTAYSVVSGCIVLAAFYVSFRGIRQYSIAEYYGKRLADVERQAEGTSSVAEETKSKYKSSSLSVTEQEAIFTQLKVLFEDKKIYLEPKLQLQDVAQMLGLSTHHLSQTINTVSGKPFYDLVNGYRVSHLQKMLADPKKKNLTILALGLDSGFNSKASLNRIFKEHTGMSPKEYQLRNAAQR